MKTYQRKDVEGKRVLLRVDFNVPMQGGEIIDPSRINAHMPTIMQLIDYGAKSITMVSHLTAPQHCGLLPVAIDIGRRLGRGVISSENSEAKFYQFHPACRLLEDVRTIFPGETENADDVSRKLASYANVFILDALSVAHRNHSSVCGVAKYLPTFAGPVLTREVVALSQLLKKPQRPFVVIIGGAKIESKMPVIDSLLLVADKILCGGKVGQELRQRGIYVNEPKVVLPIDSAENDIGAETINLFVDEIEKAETILWAGPVGKFEDAVSSAGTQSVVCALCDTSAWTVVAGGDTQRALVEFGAINLVDFISQGGGATLAFLTGKTLPGLEAVDYYS